MKLWAHRARPRSTEGSATCHTELAADIKKSGILTSVQPNEVATDEPHSGVSVFPAVPVGVRHLQAAHAG